MPLVDYSVQQDFGEVSLLKQDEISNYEEIEVVSIDDLKLPRLDLLKIDVEGMEIDVLKGAKHTIDANTPYCFAEYWIAGIEPIKQQFSNLDYRFFKVNEMELFCSPSSKLETGEIRIEGVLPEVTN